MRGKAIFLLASNNRSTSTSRSSGPLLRKRLLEARAVRLLKQQEGWFWSISEAWDVSGFPQNCKMRVKKWLPRGGRFCISKLGLDHSNSSATGFVDSGSDYSPIHMGGCQMGSYNRLQCVTVILVLSKSTSVSVVLLSSKAAKPLRALLLYLLHNARDHNRFHPLNRRLQHCIWGDQS